MRYDHVMATRTVSKTELRTKWYAILREVHEKGTVVTITKRGETAAVMSPYKAPRKRTRQ
jgi:prevent-host-death family protein